MEKDFASNELKLCIGSVRVIKCVTATTQLVYISRCSSKIDQTEAINVFILSIRREPYELSSLFIICRVHFIMYKLAGIRIETQILRELNKHEHSSVQTKSELIHFITLASQMDTNVDEFPLRVFLLCYCFFMYKIRLIIYIVAPVPFVVIKFNCN